MNKRAISISFRALISVGLISILLYIMRGNYGRILGAIRRMDVGFFAVGFLVFVVAIIVASMRLKMIIEAQGKASINLNESVSLTFVGYFFNNFLPTSIGGDVAKAYYLSRKRVAKASSFAAVFIDRAIGLFTMIFMAAAALLFFDNKGIDQSVKYMIYVITGCSALIVLFLMNKGFARRFSALLKLVRPLEDRIRRTYSSVHAYKHYDGLILKTLGISVVSQILFFISIGALAYSIGSRIPPMDILLRMPVISAMSLLPSINGLGLREGSTVLMFGPLIGKESAFVVSILWLLVLLLVSLIGGIIYAVSPQFKIKWADVEKG